MDGDNKNERTTDDPASSSSTVDKRQLARTQGRFSGHDEKKFTREKKYGSSNNSGQENQNYYQKRRVIPPRRQRHYIQGKDQSEHSRRPRIPSNEIQPQYVPNDTYQFENLKPVDKPKVLESGFHILSNTENGESSVYYYPRFLDPGKAYGLFDVLKAETEWCEKEFVIDGEWIPQPRLVAWYGPIPYSYSGITVTPKEFPSNLLQLKYQVEDKLKEKGINVEFNSVLLNHYRDNKDSVAWHSDNELIMYDYPTIASISLGEVRRFQIRKIDNSKILPENFTEYVAYLKHGSLLVMDGAMQKDWEHRVPKEYHDKMPRINLTFRTVRAIENPQSFICEIEPQRSIENAAKPKSKTTKEPFKYEDANFPSLGETKDETSAKTSQKNNQKFTDETPKAMYAEYHHQHKENMKNGREDRRKGKQFSNQNIPNFSRRSYQKYRSENHSLKKNQNVIDQTHQSDNGHPNRFCDSNPHTSLPHMSEVTPFQDSVPEHTESIRQKGRFKAYVRGSDEDCDITVERLLVVSKQMSSRLNDKHFSDRDKGEISLLLEFADAYDHLPNHLIEKLYYRMEFILKDVEASHDDEN